MGDTSANADETPCILDVSDALSMQFVFCKYAIKKKKPIGAVIVPFVIKSKNGNDA